MLSKEQIETIWRVLYPDKDPYKHKTISFGHFEYKCEKCNAEPIDVQPYAYKGPCPIPDKLPKSLAEVAEDIENSFNSMQGEQK